MKILVYGINYEPELTGIGKYSGEMSRWFADNNNEVTVVTAPPYYPEWKLTKPYKNRYSKDVVNNISVFRSPLYIPTRPGFVKRVVHLSSFALSSSFNLLRLLKLKPDVVIYVVPTLFCALPVLIYTKITGAKSVIHIQDYELDAMFGLGSGNGKGSKLSSFLFYLESKILKKFDRVSTISKNMLNKARAKGVEDKNLVLFPNWSETDRFRDVVVPGDFYSELGISARSKIVLYSGNIGKKQGLENLIPIAKKFEDEDIVFLIVGDGVGKKELYDASVSAGSKNIIFKPLLPYEQLPMLLAIAHCHLVIQKRGVADAVLPSKLTNILAAGGQSVITAEADTELGMVCRDNEGLAVLVEPENELALEKGIRKCLQLPKFNQVAQLYAENNLAKENVMASFLAELQRLSKI